MKCENCCCGDSVHYVTLCGHMRPAVVLECNYDDCSTVNLSVFTSCEDTVPVHGNESSHPVCHIECVKHCPNGTPGTWHLPSEMKS